MFLVLLGASVFFETVLAVENNGGETPQGGDAVFIHDFFGAPVFFFVVFFLGEGGKCVCVFFLNFKKEKNISS